MWVIEVWNQWLARVDNRPCYEIETEALCGNRSMAPNSTEVSSGAKFYDALLART
jgi:hypothetical protein